jgi:hypothetical protein
MKTEHRKETTGSHGTSSHSATLSCTYPVIQVSLILECELWAYLDEKVIGVMGWAQNPTPENQT